MRSHQVGEDLRAPLPHNPFVPPNGLVPFIKKLPPELLLRIFEIGTEDGDREHRGDEIAHHRDSDTHNDSIDVLTEREDKGRKDGNATGLRSPFEIVVSHVCRHWRIVTLSTPSLWTTIVVDLDARPLYEYVSTLLERSKGLPIDISVDCGPPLNVGCSCLPSDADVKLLYSLLIHHIHRWRTIQVLASQYIHIYEFLTALSDPFVSTASRLMTLKLDYNKEARKYEVRPPNFLLTQRSEPKPHILAGLSAPCLTRVVLCGVYIDWDQPWIASASRLKSLELTYFPGDPFPSWTKFATILRGAPELEKLSLRKFPPRGNPLERFTQPFPKGPTGLNTSIQLLELTDLVLAFQSATSAIWILHDLYLPALKRLTLHFDQGDYASLVDELAGQAIMSGSSTPSLEQSRNLLNRLECLKIAGILPPLGCFRRLCAELQCLTLFNVSVPYLSQAYLGVLSNPCTWLPRLTTLYISGTSFEAIRELAQKRSEAGIPLEALYVGESCVVNNEDLDWLKENLKTFGFFECGDNWDISSFENDDLEDSDSEDSDDDWDVD